MHHYVGKNLVTTLSKKYIEDQEDTPEGFKVWDEVLHGGTASAAPAFRPIPKPSSLDEGG
jgi:hypothetical protein